MGYVVLLGDSIFDNAAYVESGQSVVDQLRRALPPGWRAALLAVDGASAADVRAQLEGVDEDATHLFVSAGGNDAYNASPVLAETAGTVAAAAELLARAQARFRREYLDMLESLLLLRKPLTVCTVYDAIPGLEDAARAALALFNDVILRSAFAVSAAVIDLRLVCHHAGDYSEVSALEPSAQGAAKIVRVITDVLTQRHFSDTRAVVYR